ncbi:MAG: IS200/IS605 family transposase, partial [Rickettsia endosymbiont of Bryobia graminum]|nr:IS200/IS605 family transposase [Rickettsia endosymbiont of Bryobia graminum]
MRKGNIRYIINRYHIVCIPKYRYKLLTQVLKERIREIIAQVSEEMNIRIVNGVISSDHLHILVSIPPNIAVSEFVQR